MTDPWFVRVKSLNFGTVGDQLDWLQASVCLEFTYKWNQSPTAKPNPVTMRHLTVIEETFHTDCTPVKIPTTFETKVSRETFNHAISNLLTSRRPTLIKSSLLLPTSSHWGRVLKTLIYVISRLLTTVIVVTVVTGTAVPLLNSTAFGVVAKTRHTLFECPEPPPNSKVKVTRDMVPVVKTDKVDRVSRNEGRQRSPARSVPTVNSVDVSDDEDEDYETDTFAKIQSLFEPTKC